MEQSLEVRALLEIVQVARRHEDRAYEEWLLAIECNLTPELVEEKRVILVAVCSMAEEVTARVRTATTRSERHPDIE